MDGWISCIHCGYRYKAFVSSCPKCGTVSSPYKWPNKRGILKKVTAAAGIGVSMLAGAFLVGVILPHYTLDNYYPSHTHKSQYDAKIASIGLPPYLIQRGDFNSELVKNYTRSKVVVNGYELNVLIAATQDQKILGETIFQSIEENQGMLFVYSKEQRLSFLTMFDNFPVDIMWIDHAGKIVHTEQNVQPCYSTKECVTYYPDVLAQYNLVTNAGFTQRHGATIGSQVYFPMPP